MKPIARLTSLTAISGLFVLSAAVPPAWSDSLDVTADGVGINQTTPGAALDVQSTKAKKTDDDLLVGTNQTKAKFTLKTAGSVPNAANFQYNGNANFTGGQFAINLLESDGGFGSPEELTLDGAGNLEVQGTVNGSSSVTVKDNITPIDVHQVLASVTDLPIARWNYREDHEVPHIGPMAEDFHAAFAVGSDEKHISMVDSDGVALAAIQALDQNQKAAQEEIAQLELQLQEKNRSLQELQQYAGQQREAIEAVQARLEALETAQASR
jgi:uncharacterized coiled-coil protein SlyX